MKTTQRFGARPRRALAALLPLALLAGGCARTEMADLDQWVGQVKARKHSQIDPLPEIRVPEVFYYEVADRQDPFRPLVETAPEQLASKPTSGITPPPNHVREELEQYPLDTLRMVGTLEKDERLWALVIAPDGAVHRVLPGNFAGRNYGKVTLVAEDRVELVEIIPDGIGGWQERTAKLDLAE
jgi:type IV pilus assembly protein PilP